SEVPLLLLLLHPRAAGVLVDRPALPLARGGEKRLLDHLAERSGLALDRTGQRVTAERAEADRTNDRLFARRQREALVIDHHQHPVTLHRGPRGCEVERDD